jgi:histone-lysine N-methyltransferase SETD2
LPVDDRYSVEKIPLYDSAEDEPSTRLFKTVNSSNSEFDGNRMIINVNVDSEHQLMSTALVVQSLDSDPMEGVVMEVKNEVSKETKLYSQDNQPAFLKKNAMISRIRSNTACRNYHIGSGSISNKRSKQGSNGRLKHFAQKQVDAKSVALLLASNEAQEEILKHEVFCVCVFFYIFLFGLIYSIY